MAAPEKAEIRKPVIPLLEQVREGLQKDPNVFFAGEIRIGQEGQWVDTIDIIVAPISPIYDPDELNKFQDTLIPNIRHTEGSGAVKYDVIHDFLPGLFCYDETIGATVEEIKTTTVTREPEILREAGIPIGNSLETKRTLLQRRIYLRVYPESTLAQVVAQYEKDLFGGKHVYDKTLDAVKERLAPRQYESLARENGCSLARVLELLKKGSPYIIYQV